MQTQPSERKHSGHEINNTCWWTEFKILPSWETPSGFGQKPSTSPLTWRCTARWCLLCLEFYDLGHTHMPVLAGFMDSMVTEMGSVSTQKVWERWSHRRMRSNFMWGQKIASFGRVRATLLCFLRTWELRSLTPSGPPFASALLRETAWQWYPKHRRNFDFGYLLCEGMENHCQKL